MAASASFIQASTRVESVGMSRTRGNVGTINLHRVREARVGMAIADHKDECRTADRFDCGGIFSCNSRTSKSTEASVTLWRGTGLAVTNNVKTHQIENVQKEHRKSDVLQPVRFGTDLLTALAHPCSVASRNKPLQKDITARNESIGRRRRANQQPTTENES
jgi:hypothetical protein